MKKDETIKIGIIGVGHLGNFHINQLKGISEISISGIYDIDINRAQEMSLCHNVKSYPYLEEVLKLSDAVCIVTPTKSHYSVANKALDYNCHLFIEKPITYNLQDAEVLLKKAKKLNKIIQVGHIERFNQAFLQLKHSKIKPQFIEAHRLDNLIQEGMIYL